MIEEVTPAQVSMVRGIYNCGKHNEENKSSPAIQFAQECDGCAARIFSVIWRTERDDALRMLRGK
jgi:hypothetical protein